MALVRSHISFPVHCNGEPSLLPPGLLSLELWTSPQLNETSTLPAPQSHAVCPLESMRCHQRKILYLQHYLWDLPCHSNPAVRKHFGNSKCWLSKRSGATSARAMGFATMSLTVPHNEELFCILPDSHMVEETIYNDLKLEFNSILHINPTYSSHSFKIHWLFQK